MMIGDRFYVEACAILSEFACLIIAARLDPGRLVPLLAAESTWRQTVAPSTKSAEHDQHLACSMFRGFSGIQRTNTTI